MKTLSLLCFVCWAAIAAQQAPSTVFDVKAHGAAGDGKTNDTKAIQQAIDACARSGGGTVHLPAGTFVSGTLVLKSNVTLYLSAGATLAGSRRIEDYQPNHLIYAKGAENIGIEGPGKIDGNGDAFWYPDFKPHKRRPSPLIELVDCRDVRIRDVRIRNTPGWGIHPLNCERVEIRGISMISPMRGPNTDGIDPDSSRHVIISDSYIETGDDCIVLKTTGRAGMPARACENVIVNNCVLVSDDAALKLGTESHGDFRNIVFSNIVVRNTRVALAIYAKDGGTFEDVSFSNISIDTHSERSRSAQYPILIDLEKRLPESRQSRVRRISFSDLTLTTRGRVLVAGMPEQPLEDLTFRNIMMRITGFEAVEKLSKPRGSANVRKVDRGSDYSSVPAAVIFANARGVRLRDFSLLWDADGPPPERHAVYAGGVEDLTISGFHGRQAKPGGSLAVLGFDQVKNVFVSNSVAAAGAGAFAAVGGGATGEVVLEGNNLRNAREEVGGTTYVHR